MAGEPIKYRSHHLNIAELWYDHQIPTSSGIDIVRFRQSLVPFGTECVEFHTLVNDLSRSDEEIISEFSKETRYEIRRAEEKDGLGVETWDGACPEFFEEFVVFFNAFARVKKLSPVDQRLLHQLRGAGRLEISRVSGPDKSVLVMHAYYRYGERSRLLYSASNSQLDITSSLRALIGRANRWLHWRDMVRLRGLGVVSYDWGGWYEGSEDLPKLQINRFKESFGGRAVCTYNGEILLTLKARILASLAKLIRRR